MKFKQHDQTCQSTVPAEKKTLAELIEKVNLSQILKLISCFLCNYTQRKKFSKMVSTRKNFFRFGHFGQNFYLL